MYYQVFEKKSSTNVLGSGVNIAIFKSSVWRAANGGVTWTVSRSTPKGEVLSIWTRGFSSQQSYFLMNSPGYCLRLRHLPSKALESQEHVDTTNAFRAARLLLIFVFLVFLWRMHWEGMYNTPPNLHLHCWTPCLLQFRAVTPGPDVQQIHWSLN